MLQKIKTVGQRAPLKWEYHWIRYIIFVSMFDYIFNFTFAIVSIVTGVPMVFAAGNNCYISIVRICLNFSTWLTDIVLLLTLEGKTSIRYSMDMSDLDGSISNDWKMVAAIMSLKLFTFSIFSMRLYWYMLHIKIKPFGSIFGLKLSVFFFLNLTLLYAHTLIMIGFVKKIIVLYKSQNMVEIVMASATQFLRILALVVHICQVLYGIWKRKSSLLRSNFYFRLYFWPIFIGIFYTWEVLQNNGSLNVTSCRSFFLKQIAIGIRGVYAGLFTSLIFIYSRYMDLEKHDNSHGKIRVIGRKNLEISAGEEIGNGNFSHVFSGYLKERHYLFFWKCKITPVAIKAVKICEEQLDSSSSLFEEMKNISRGFLMKQGHPNLIRFYGVCLLREDEGFLSKVNIVMELCNGNVKEYLQSGKPLGSDCQLLWLWSLQVASAMSFLEKHKIVHGDLAARNVLLDFSISAKVSDFGMARKLYGYKDYVKSNAEIFPWRWMAPESLKDFKFSSKSDVWSYGVFLWEVFSLGNTPCEELDWTQDFILNLENGFRLVKPDEAPEILYTSVMLNCWDVIPQNRPTFQEICTALDKMKCSLHDNS